MVLLWSRILGVFLYIRGSFFKFFFDLYPHLVTTVCPILCASYAFVLKILTSQASPEQFPVELQLPGTLSRLKLSDHEALGLNYFIQRMRGEDTAAPGRPLLKRSRTGFRGGAALMSVTQFRPQAGGFLPLFTGGDERGGPSTWEAAAARAGTCRSDGTERRRSQ